MGWRMQEKMKTQAFFILLVPWQMWKHAYGIEENIVGTKFFLFSIKALLC